MQKDMYHRTLGCSELFSVYTESTMRRSDGFNLAILVILASLTVLDVFLWPGRPITFDGQTHLITIAQFAQALRAGDFPVIWTNSFAHYGLPLGLFAHQLSSYAGAVLFIISGNLVSSYNLLLLCATVSSSIAMYLLLKAETGDERASLLGSVLYLLAPYRILNIYVRGALPELLATSMLLFVLLCVKLCSQYKNAWAYAGLIVTTFLLVTAHPMMIVIGSLIVLPYSVFSVFCTLSKKTSLKTFFLSIFPILISYALGLLLASYYLLPLLLEMKYFVIGSAQSVIFKGGFLSIDSFFYSQWKYFGGHPGPRDQFLSAGLWESLVVLGTGMMVWVNRQSLNRYKAELFWLFIAVICAFLLTSASQQVYSAVPFLASIQFPFRFLTVFSFVPPLLFAHYITKSKEYWFGLVCIFVVCAVRFPQLYTKNMIVQDESVFYASKKNVHTDNLNTIWMGSADSYADRKNQVEVLSGTGKIESVEVQNSSRKITTTSSEPIRLLDKTFYFPGWHVYVDGIEVPIEFQDIEHRGVITYMVPAGSHNVFMNFSDTKVRLVGKVLSGIGLILSLLFLYFSRFKFSKRI